MGTALVFLEAEVLSPTRKMMEVAVIRGTDFSKEILVSLKYMKYEVFTMSHIQNTAFDFKKILDDKDIIKTECLV